MTANDAPRDVAEGLVGALGMLFDLATPFLRGVRSHYGLTSGDLDRRLLGDDRVPVPAWSWTHGVEIEAPAEAVWPWVAQIGQGKGGFYSYQWLENLAGCQIQNADRIHPEWTEISIGDRFRLHPSAPPLGITDVEPGRAFVVSDVFDPATGRTTDRAHPERWVHVSWLFLVEPLDPGRSRFISRYRVAYGPSAWMRLLYGAWTIESIGFVMDRRMLIGVKERAEVASH